MIDQHFMKNGSPTLKWYKSHYLSVRKPKKLFEARKRRVINYDRQLAEVLTCQYNTETNFRLENDVKNDQFIFTIVNATQEWSRIAHDFSTDAHIMSENVEGALKRLVPLPKFDWRPENRFKGKTIAKTIEQYAKSYLKKGYKDEYLSCWLHGYSKFGAGWKVEYAHSKRKFPVAKILEDLHRKKIPFRIECFWDNGFIGVLVNKEVTPSRVQVDEYNSIDREDIHNLFEVPECDWLKRFYAPDIEEVVRKMVREMFHTPRTMA